MMFSDYTDLQEDVRRRLNRAVTTSFRFWLREMETWLSGGLDLTLGNSSLECPALRILEMEASETFDSVPEGGVELPEDYLDLRDIRGELFGETVEVIYQPLSTFSDLQRRGETRPIYTLREKRFQFSEYLSPPIQLQYYRKIPELTPENYSTHIISSLDDSTYLHGVLASAHIQYRNIPGASIEIAFLKAAVGRLNAQARRARDGEAPMRTVIVGGIP